MKWLNALGMILQFISFWFAAPELLGVSTLKRFEKGLQKFISIIPMILLMIIIAGFGIGLGLMGFLKGLKGASQGLEEGEFFRYLAILGGVSIVYVIFVIRFKRIERWLEMKLAKPLTERLINSNHTRTNALIIGALLFTIGFVCQFLVAIL
jgi:hypothetical protein